MLNFGRWQQRESVRLVVDVWQDVLNPLYIAARTMTNLGYRQIALKLEWYASCLERDATEQLEALTIAPEPRPYEPLRPESEPPTNGYAHAALEDSNSAAGFPGSPVADVGAEAAGDEKAAADGGHSGLGPSSDASLRPVAADPSTVDVKAVDYDLVEHIERMLIWVRSQDVVSQQRDICEKQLYTIRSEARDPRMQASARMKFEAVLKLLKGVA